MNKPSICIIGVYFGPLPEWINVWLASVKNNSTVDFLLVTDQNNIDFPDIPNLYIKNMTMQEFKKAVETTVGFKVKLANPYKVCDYKEIYGLVFKDNVKDYDYWGECDFDVVWGDLRSFFDKYQLQKYDKFLNRGHLTLYKNSAEVNNRYKLSGGKFGSYREVFKSDLNWAFDETMGIDSIYIKHQFPYFDEFVYADINPNFKDIRMVERPGKYCKNYDHQIFYYEGGKILRDYVDGDEVIKTDELMYIHLQKRKMKRPDFDPSKHDFYITNWKFVVKKQKATRKIMDLYNKKNDNSAGFHSTKFKKDAKFYWLGRRWLNFRYAMNKKLRP